MASIDSDRLRGDVLQRFGEGRLTLLETRDRLVALRQRAAAERAHARRLRDEARAVVGTVSATRASARCHGRTDRGARRWSFVPAPGPAGAEQARLRMHEAYAATRDAAVRDDLMAAYDNFARSLARNFRHREATDDLVQVARIGLLQALNRFDPALGRPFPVFARATILGELKRHLRDRTWAMRIPRSLKDDYVNVMRAVDELSAGREASPPMQALADHCGISVERVVEALELRQNQWVLSVDGAPSAGSDEPPLEIGQEEIGFRQLEDRQLLARLLARLPERDRRIIELRYLAEMTQTEIAAEVGVSQMCVSRVLARTLGRLRLWARTAVA
jgi:RNA polymerase sigma-B factor